MRVTGPKQDAAEALQDVQALCDSVLYTNDPAEMLLLLDRAKKRLEAGRRAVIQWKLNRVAAVEGMR